VYCTKSIYLLMPEKLIKISLFKLLFRKLIVVFVHLYTKLFANYLGKTLV